MSLTRSIRRASFINAVIIASRARRLKRKIRAVKEERRETRAKAAAVEGFTIIISLRLNSEIFPSYCFSYFLILSNKIVVQLSTFRFLASGMIIWSKDS